MHLGLVGLTAGWPAGRRNTDGVRKFQNSLGVKLFGLLLLLIAMQCYNSVRNIFQSAFSNIANPKACFKVRKIWMPFFSYRSLLLSTSVLNDYAYIIE